MNNSVNKMNKLKAGKSRSIASDFKNDDYILWCILCDIFIGINDKHIKTWVWQHIEAPKHIKSSHLKNPKNKELFIRNILQKAAINETSSYEIFIDLTTTLMEAGVPL